MGSFLPVLAFTLVGLLLLWFGYTLVFRMESRRDSGKNPKGRYQKTAVQEGIPGNPKTCPVCSSLLEYGERVKSAAFPGIPNQGRMMHISGCVYCLDGDRLRTCPVCGAIMENSDYLIARMFDRPGRSHVHVLGCTQCRQRRLPGL
jgi:hypothetical protein